MATFKELMKEIKSPEYKQKQIEEQRELRNRFLKRRVQQEFEVEYISFLNTKRSKLGFYFVRTLPLILIICVFN